MSKPPENGIHMTSVRDENYDLVGVTRYYLEGKEVTEDEYYAVFPRPTPGCPMSTNAWAHPLLSDALAVHPSQVAEANERNRRRGCSVTYREDDGRAIIPDRGERKKLLKIEQMHDRDGGYGDG